MTAVVFETPGLIDLRAFTIMGAHAKPNSTNPIGFFGTGLKYAIAVLVRLGAEPVVYIGRDKIVFSKKTSKFRGSDLETIKMSVHKDGNKRATAYELPFTTRYGARWEPWMAFREIESNTRDENGKTWIVEDTAKVADVNGILLAGLLENDKTMVVVENCPEFFKAAKEIDSIFLPRARREGRFLEAIDANDRPAEKDAFFLYYRTMRALKLGKPTIYTYNFLESLVLTEDRTLAYNHQVRDVFARWVLTEATEAQVEAIVTAKKEWWESDLEFPGHVTPSEAFRAVMARKPKGISHHASGYYSGYLGGGYRRRVKRTFSLFQTAPIPWKLSGDFVFDARKAAVFERPDDMDGEDWDNIAATIIDKLGAGERPEVEPEPESVEEVAAELVAPGNVTEPSAAETEIPF